MARLSFWIAAAILFATSLAVSVAYAQATLSSEISDGQIEAALADLSDVYGAEVVRVDQAKAICNQEQYFVDCAEIGQRHGLFSEDRAEQVEDLLSEFKDDIVEKLKQCGTTQCLVEVATSLAKSLAVDNPTLARSIDLTPQKVKEKQAIVDAAEELGVDVDDCRTMDPETADVELLRACAKLAKHKDVQKLFGDEDKERVGKIDGSIALKAALREGAIQCGDGTMQGCGSFCLNPSVGARAEGVAAIPQICRDIATRFFGSEGENELERAYESVRGTVQAITQSVRAASFTTESGQTLTDPAAIGRFIEEAGRRGDVTAVEGGMSFLVSNGFITAEERDFATAMVQRMAERGTNVDECLTNPEQCADSIPEEHRGEFALMSEIENVMRRELQNRGIGDLSQCGSGGEAGKACLEAAKSALPQFDEFADSPESIAVIEGIRKNIRFGEEGQNARVRAEERLRSGEFVVGDFVVRSVGELETFCASNGDKCLADGVRTGLVSRDVAAEKYQNSVAVRYNYGPYSYHDAPYADAKTSFKPLTSEERENAMRQFEAWLDNPQGPPPTPSRPSPYPRAGDDASDNSNRNSLCPMSGVAPPCPAGEYRQEHVNEFGCFVRGACIPIATKTERPQRDKKIICPAMPTVDSCPDGGERVATYSSPECGTYYTCQGKKGDITTEFPYTFASGKTVESWSAVRSYCYESGMYGATMRKDTDECKRVFGISVPETPPEKQCAQWGLTWHRVDESGNCFNASNTEYRTPDGALQQCTSARVFGCAWEKEQVPSGQKQYTWNSLGLKSMIRADADPQRLASLKDACASVDRLSDVWTLNAGDSSSKDFGMPDSEKCKKAGLCQPLKERFDGRECVGSPIYDPVVVDSCRNIFSESSCSAKTTCKWFAIPASSQSSGAWSGGYCENKDYVMPGDRAGDQNSCPGFSYSRWDKTGTRYCQLNNTRSCQYFHPAYLTESSYASSSCPEGEEGTVTGSCSSEMISLLGSGCHNRGSAWFDLARSKYVLPNTKIVKSCVSEQISGCAIADEKPQCADGKDNDGDGKTDYPNDTGCYSASDWDETIPSSSGSQKTQIWNSFGLQSSIREDADPSRIASLKQACANVSSGANIWMGGSGTYSSPDFGMPDPNRCAKAAACTSAQKFDGTSCVADAPGGNTGSMQRCYYPNATRNGQPTGYTVWCEADYVNCREGSPSAASISVTGVTLGAPSSCDSGWSGGGGGCGMYTSQTSCSGMSACKWENNACMVKSSGGTTCYGTYTTQSSCSAASCTWYDNHYDGTHCDNASHGTATGGGNYGSCTNYASQASCTSTPNCYWYSASGSQSSYCYYQSGSTGSSCPSGQYWNGTTCTTSSGSSCGSGSYWDSRTSSCQSMQTACAEAGGTWSSSSNYCQMPNSYTSGSGGSGSSCSSGQYWNGSSCVTSSTSDTGSSSSSCGSGMYWDSQTNACKSNGSACTEAGGTWSSSSNYCQMSSSGGSQACGPGQYWDSASNACVTNPTSGTTSYFCLEGDSWNGSYCTLAKRSALATYTANAFSAFKSLLAIFGL